MPEAQGTLCHLANHGKCHDDMTSGQAVTAQQMPIHHAPLFQLQVIHGGEFPAGPADLVEKALHVAVLQLLAGGQQAMHVGAGRIQPAVARFTAFRVIAQLDTRAQRGFSHE
jgi:hypothetical protein